MSGLRPFVIYGVSGSTGRLVAEYLREYDIPFVAAGRKAASSAMSVQYAIHDIAARS